MLRYAICSEHDSSERQDDLHWFLDLGTEDQRSAEFLGILDQLLWSA